MKREQIEKLTLTGVFTAIIILMSCIPAIGYIKIGLVEITMLPIPVALGAITVGPLAGLFLGFVFGVTSLVQCFGVSSFGTLLMSIDPFLTVVLCLVPRALTGLLAGYIFRFLAKFDRIKFGSFVITGLMTALMNTAFFIGLFAWFFHGKGDFQGQTVLDLILLLLSTNALIEAGACTVVSAGVGKALVHFLPRIRLHRANDRFSE